jgi:hypothetical protein
MMVTPEEASTEALQALSRREVDQLPPVVKDGAVRGLIRREDSNFSISPGNFIETKPQCIEKQGITFLNSPICPDLLRSYL